MKKSTLALILAIAALLTSLVIIGGCIAVPAIILGILALARLAKQPEPDPPAKRRAVIAIALGSIAIPVAIVAAVILAAVLAPVIAPHDPLEQNILSRLQPPHDDFYLGTDYFGRDILSRLLYGARISLVIGIASTVIAMVAGSLIGLLAGYYGGRFDVVVECLNKLPFCAPAYSAVPVLAVSHHLFGASAFAQAPWPIAAAVVALERAIPRVYRDGDRVIVRSRFS